MKQIEKRQWTDLGWQLVGALFALATIAALGFLVYRGETTRDLVQASPCTLSPESRACAEQRQAVARAEPIKNPCISFQRVTGSRGRNCDRRFVEKRQVQANSKEVQNLEFGAGGTNAPVIGGSPQGTGQFGDGTDKGDQPDRGSRHPKTSKPPAPAPVATQPPASTSPPPPVTNPAGKEVPADPPGLLPSTLEATGKTVKQVEETGNQLLCTVRGLLGPCP